MARLCPAIVSALSAGTTVHRLTVRIGSRNNGQGEHAHGNRSARDPDETRLRYPSIQKHAREQAQRPTRERRHRDVTETLNVNIDMREESPHKLANQQMGGLGTQRARVERVERGRGRLLEFFDVFRILLVLAHAAAESAIIGE
jgi:hypothetical protein